MKKYLLFIFLSSPLLAHSQIMVSTATDWAHYIPLITGGKSITVSNIQIHGSPGAFGYYQAAGGEFNLTHGILMTSGSVSAPYGPIEPNTSPNGGFDNGAPGHTLATSIGGTTSFNSSIIEFDFSSPVNDTLQLSYLFGSDEYKEYVGSAYNDVFGFYVTAGPGITSPVNIAVIPGTSTPIAINNVNHITNSSYYIDNEFPPGNILQYDGLVRLTTEPFPVQPNQTYHIFLIVSDIADGIYDSGVFLELQQGNQTLCGQILYEGVPAGPGQVELIAYTFNEADAVVIETAFTDSTGIFSFDTVGYGGYILRSTLNPIDYPLAYPVYLDSVVVWNMADIQYLPTLDTSCNVLHHRELPIGTGPGIINGTIVNDNLVKFVGLVQGKSDTYIFAYNENNELKAAGKVDKNGQYELTGLEDGIYTIYVDYLGYSMVDTNHITIDASNESFTANYLTKNKEKQIIRLLDEPVTTDNFTAITYPNPSNGDFTMFLNSPSFMRDLQIQVCDMRGRVIYTQVLNNISEGQSFYRFDLAESVPSDGLYVIQLYNESVKNVMKILVGK